MTQVVKKRKKVVKHKKLKYNFTLHPEVAEPAKDKAADLGKSLSQVIEDYLKHDFLGHKYK